LPVGGLLYFTADDGTHGTELWVSDGTDTGTVMVSDVNPGVADSLPAGLVAFGNRLLFVADDGVHGRELWVTDAAGRSAGLLVDLQPGAGSSKPLYPQVIGDLLYFVADDGVHGAELWATDGTSAGTVMLADANPGPGSSYPDASLMKVGGALYFVASDGVENALWTTLGTPATTHRVCDPSNHFAFVTRTMAVAQGKLFFQADSNLDDTGRELYQLDPTVMLPASCP
jgi:ELWxxDGT repeat protein